jgi:hypothetical protein
MLKMGHMLMQRYVSNGSKKKNIFPLKDSLTAIISTPILNMWQLITTNASHAIKSITNIKTTC